MDQRAVALHRILGNDYFRQSDMSRRSRPIVQPVYQHSPATTLQGPVRAVGGRTTFFERQATASMRGRGFLGLSPGGALAGCDRSRRHAAWPTARTVQCGTHSQRYSVSLGRIVPRIWFNYRQLESGQTFDTTYAMARLRAHDYFGLGDGKIRRSPNRSVA